MEKSIASHISCGVSHRSAYHCVGWHAVVCYGGPEWFRMSPSLLSARVLSDESSIELSWEFFDGESSSPSSASGRLPVKAEKSMSRLN